MSLEGDPPPAEPQLTLGLQPVKHREAEEPFSVAQIPDPLTLRDHKWCFKTPSFGGAFYTTIDN